MTTLQANPSVTLAEALHRLEESGEPVILRGPDGKDCAALVSLNDLHRLAGRQPTAALAPDGLPWPQGYFDHPPVVSLEDAMRTFGVRPHQYFLGRPAWTPEERRDPAFKWPYPPEPEWANDLSAEQNAEKPKVEQ